VDDAIHIATPKGDYGAVEDLHLILDPLLSSYLMRLTMAGASPRESAADKAQTDALQTTA